MTDIIIVAVLAAILCGAAGYVVQQKKRGAKCLGCPYSGSGSCSCHK